jgi:hypothetical protein
LTRPGTRTHLLTTDTTQTHTRHTSQGGVLPVAVTTALPGGSGNPHTLTTQDQRRRAAAGRLQETAKVRH